MVTFCRPSFEMRWSGTYYVEQVTTNLRLLSRYIIICLNMFELDYKNEPKRRKNQNGWATILHITYY
jgi:hypothetical protein